MEQYVKTPNKIYVGKSPIHGLGVFASEKILTGELIEECPILSLPSLYNHSESPNAYWFSNYEKRTFSFVSSRDIEPGEEIFVWYGDVNYWNDGRNHISVVE